MIKEMAGGADNNSSAKKMPACSTIEPRGGYQLSMGSGPVAYTKTLQQFGEKTLTQANRFPSTALILFHWTKFASA